MMSLGEGTCVDELDYKFQIIILRQVSKSTVNTHMSPDTLLHCIAHKITEFITVVLFSVQLSIYSLNNDNGLTF